MDKDNDDIFGGFSAVASDLSGRTSDDIDVLDGGPIGGDPVRRPPVTKEIEEEEDFEEEVEEGEEEDEIEEDDTDGESDDDDELTEAEKEAIELKKKKAKKSKDSRDSKKKEGKDDADDFGDAEPEIAEYLQERLFEKFNLDNSNGEFGKFKSMNDVTDFIEEAIKANSIPEFANEDVANIDTYVRNGGSLAEYMKEAYGSKDLNSIDLEDINTQKAIIREDLLNQGMSAERVNKRLERMEDTGILFEEAEDAMESLKEYRTKQQETLLQNQKKVKADQEKANLDFVRSVESELDAMDNVRGIPLTKAEKDKLYNYMLRPTSEGVPQYHIDYKNHRKNMIESAYFTMMGDKLIKKVETKANSTAAKKLKNKLADKGRRGKNQSMNSGFTDSWSSIAKALR